MTPDDPSTAYTGPDPDTLVRIVADGRDLHASVLSSTLATVESSVIGPALQAALEAAAEGLRYLIVDLSEVSFISSSALSMLIEVQTFARTRAASVVLAGVRDEVMEVVSVTRLEKVLAVCRTPAELEQAMGKNR